RCGLPARRAPAADAPRPLLRRRSLSRRDGPAHRRILRGAAREGGGRGGRAGKLYGERVERAEAGGEWGFTSFCVAEHHFHEYGAVPRPPILLSAVAQRTRRIRLGSGVVGLPFDHPLRVRGDYAMVDVLSAGRLNLGVGSGYLKHE